MLFFVPYNDTTCGASKINTTFEGNFGTLDYKDMPWEGQQISLLCGRRVRFLDVAGLSGLSHFQSLFFKPVFEHCVGLWGDAYKLD